MWTLTRIKDPSQAAARPRAARGEAGDGFRRNRTGCERHIAEVFDDHRRSSSLFVGDGIRDRAVHNRLRPSAKAGSPRQWQEMNNADQDLFVGPIQFHKGRMLQQARSRDHKNGSIINSAGRARPGRAAVDHPQAKKISIKSCNMRRFSQRIAKF